MKQNKRIDRREALKIGGAVLAAAGALNFPAGAGQQPKKSKKIIVAGGGIAGLCCAYELQRRGHEVSLLEADNRTGGHVKTFREPLADGLYADVGAEHFTKPGYDRYWSYVDEFKLPALAYPRRENILRRVQGKMYTEEMLADPKVLRGFGLNNREVEYLTRHPWWSLASLYYAPYIDNFEDEYQPLRAKLDHLDDITLNVLLRKDGASAAAIELIGNDHASALHLLWHAAILKLRGVPLFPTQVFRLRGGNQTLPDTFANKLGARVKTGCPVTGIEHGATGVSVKYREAGQEKKLDADYLVCAMSAVMLRRIPITPNWSAAKEFVVKNMPYYIQSRVMFQSRTPFWKRENISPNMEFGDGSLHFTWQMAEEVETSRALLVATADATTTPEQALAAFRRLYPGKSDDIERAHVYDWAQETWTRVCETVHYPVNWMKKMWPATIEPEGRIHFVGAYADNLNWGMEAGTRSANRVAEAIDRA